MSALGLWTAVFTFVSYFVCGIPFGLIIAHATGHVDVRRTGSGNIGTTNVARSVGKGAAAIFAPDPASHAAAHGVLDPVAICVDLDESSLTGESLPVTHRTGSAVMSGALNGTRAFVLEATASAADSQYAAIVSLVQQAADDRRLAALEDLEHAALGPALAVVAHDAHAHAVAMQHRAHFLRCEVDVAVGMKHEAVAVAMALDDTVDLAHQCSAQCNTRRRRST